MIAFELECTFLSNHYLSLEARHGRKNEGVHGIGFTGRFIEV